MTETQSANGAFWFIAGVLVLANGFGSSVFYPGARSRRNSPRPLPMWPGRISTIVVGLLFCQTGLMQGVPPRIAKLCLLAAGIVLVISRPYNLVRRRTMITSSEIFAVAGGVVMSLAGIYFPLVQNWIRRGTWRGL